MNTLGFDHVEKIESARLAKGDDGKHRLHVVLQLRDGLEIEEGRTRVHLTDGVNHEYAEVDKPLSEESSEEAPPEDTSSTAPMRKRQFKKNDGDEK